MSRPVVETMDIEDMVHVRAGAEELPERALALAVIHQAIVDLTTRPSQCNAAAKRQRFVAQRYGAALFLIGDPTRKPQEGSYREMRALWCGVADVSAEALESMVWQQHGPLLRHVLDHPPETPRSKWKELLRRRRHARKLRWRRAVA